MFGRGLRVPQAAIPPSVSHTLPLTLQSLPPLTRTRTGWLVPPGQYQRIISQSAQRARVSWAQIEQASLISTSHCTGLSLLSIG